jgi:hypothetical protein
MATKYGSEIDHIPIKYITPKFTQIRIFWFENMTSGIPNLRLRATGREIESRQGKR